MVIEAQWDRPNVRARQRVTECLRESDDGETIIVRRGARRSGGSYLERARRIALWNTVMDEHNYAARAWTRFVSSVSGKSR